MRSAMTWIVLVAVLCLPAMGRGQVSPGQPQLFTLEGILAPDQAAADKVGYDPLSIGGAGAAGTLRWIGVVGARSLDGDAFQGKEVVESLLGDRPNLLVAGSEALLTKLRTAPDGSRLVLQGILDPATRNYMLDKVDVRPASAAP